jgi:hypothetical protein
MNACTATVLLLGALAGDPATPGAPTGQSPTDLPSVPGPTIPSERSTPSPDPATAIEPAANEAKAPERPAPASTTPRSNTKAVEVPSAPTCAPPARAGTRGFQVIPSLGINLPVGTGSDNHWFGTNLGLLVGWKTAGRASLNAQLSLDSLDIHSASQGPKPEEKYTDIALAPLFHIETTKAILVFGPTLGFFHHTVWQSDSDGTKLSSRGLSVGLNLGIFVPLGRIALGGVLNGRLHQTTRSDGWEKRQDGSTLGLAGAVMF